MNKIIFTEQDMDDDTMQFIDKYFKTVIIHTKHKFVKEIYRYEMTEIKKENMESSLEDKGLNENEEDYEDIFSDCFIVEGISIPVYNADLAKALHNLKKVQLDILIRNVLLKTPVNKIADDLGISTRMVKKHKHNAIDAIKRSMKINE